MVHPGSEEQKTNTARVLAMKEIRESDKFGSGILSTILINLAIKLAMKWIEKWVEDNLFDSPVPTKFEELE